MSLRFRDFLTNYDPNRDEYLQYRAQKRRRLGGSGGPVGESADLSEEMTDAQKKKREEYVLKMKGKAGDFKKRYGDRWKDVMYATATKMAMKEEVERIDEINKSQLGKHIGTVNGYHIHDMGANYPHKNKRFVAAENDYGWLSHSGPTAKEVKDKAKTLKKSTGPEVKTKAQQDHDDWRDKQKQRIASGEVRKAVMSRRVKEETEINEEALARDSNGNPITMQDVRLYAGEGKLTKKTIAQAISIIKKHRADGTLKYKVKEETEIDEARVVRGGYRDKDGKWHPPMTRNDLAKAAAAKRKEIHRKTAAAMREAEETEIDEALTMAQRRKKALQMKKYKSRMKIGRERAERRTANMEVLKKRAMKKARDVLVKKLTKDVPKSELDFSRRQQIEKRLDKMKPAIQRIAKKLIPVLRKAEMERKKKR